MAVTVRDCLQLEVLKDVKVLGGKNGLDNIVSNVTVAEIHEGGYYEVLMHNELVITAMYSIKDNVKKQLEFIKKLVKFKCSGIIIFYVGIYIKEISKELIQLSNKLDFPLIVITENKFDLSYSKVISKISRLIINSDEKQFFLSDNTYDKLFEILNEKKSFDFFLEFIANETNNSVILTNTFLEPVVWYLNKNSQSLKMDKLYKYFQIIDNKELTKTCEFDGYYLRGIPLYVNKIIIGFFIVLNKKDDFVLTNNDLKNISNIVKKVLYICDYPKEISSENEWINLLINGQIDKAFELSKIHNINYLNISDINTLLFINIDEKYKDDELLKTQLIKTIKVSFELLTNKCFVGTDGQSIIALINTNKLKNKISKLRNIGEYISKKYNYENNHVLNLVFSNFIKDAYDIHYEYNKFKGLLELANIIFPLNNIFFADELTVLSIFKDTDESEYNFYIRLIEPILIHDKRYSTNYIQTLAAYFLDYNCSMKKTAENLFIHINTLKYRLQVIRKIIGYDFLTWPNKIDYFVALAAFRLQNLKYRILKKEFN